MTKEQEKAIEYLTKDLKKADMLKMTVHTDNESVRVILDLVKQQQEENKQKDKMTNLMLEEYEYNERINIKYFCDEEIRKNTCIQDCKLCIKQYFEKKVSEEKTKHS